MYEIITLKESVRVPPKFLEENTAESVKKALQESMEGILDKDIGVLLCVTDIKEISDGNIIAGDGAVYYETVFDALVYRPELHEVSDGEVIEVVEFGIFVRLGPLDGLVHVSQIADEFMNFSKDGILTGKGGARSIKVGDKVRARIVTLSLKQTSSSKIGLTMKQPGLGKFEWLEEERKKESGGKR
jgi:DNA-directed RNA polymerase subunit E'